MTCERCALLEEQVACLNDELGHRTDVEGIQALKRAFGLSPAAALVVRNLYLAKGRTVGGWALLDSLPARREERSSKVLQTHCSRIRSSLGKDAVQNVWGEGYRLSQEARAKVAAVLTPLSSSAAANKAAGPASRMQRPD